MNVIGIVAIVLLVIIVYFFIRLRQMMKNTVGARSDMNTLELIKNWQDQKAKEAQRQAELREKARKAAEPEIERAIIEKYKQEEIAKATASTGDKMKNTLKQGLGIDSDKVFGRDNVDRMIGKRKIEGIDTGVDTNKIFSSERIDKMSGHNSMDADRIKQASGHIDWDKGIKRGLDSGSQFTGLDKALGKDRKNRHPPNRP